MNVRRLEELIDHYVDHRLSPTEKSELEDLLLQSPEARRQFWDRMQFEGAVAETVSARHVSDWMTRTERNALQRPGEEVGTAWWRKLLAVWPALTAVGLLAVGAVAWIFHAGSRPSFVPEETTNGVAVVANVWNVKWPNGQPPLSRGSVLMPGAVRIAAGVLGIEFFNGVRMTLEGPADIELSKVNEATCRRGRLRVLVPNIARNFRVRTERADVFDLGTEFGMEVGANTQTEIHVFDGKVEWVDRNTRSPTRPKRELTAGHAVRLNDAGLSLLPARPDDFMSRRQLESLVQKTIEERHQVWRAVSRQLQHDHRTLLHFDFDQESTHHGLVTNRALQAQAIFDGVVVGCEQTQGRWPGRRGLEFKRPGDRVRVFVPGTYDQLTYLIWVRVDRLKRDHAALFLTDGFEPGATHWQIHQGRVRLGLGDAQGRPDVTQITPDVQSARFGVNYDSPLLFSDAAEGNWCQLALVIDSVRGEVRHFFNGRKVSEAPMIVRQKLSIGSAELGNWGLPASTDRQPVRNFDGRIDEFIIFQEALTDDEITRLYEQSSLSLAPARLAKR